MRAKHTKFLVWRSPLLLLALSILPFSPMPLKPVASEPTDAAVDEETLSNWKMEIAPQFDIAGDFSEGLAKVGVATPVPPDQPVRPTYGYKDIDKYGYINRAGKLVIPFQYKRAGDFSEGLAWVAYESDDPNSSAEKFGFIDRTGKLVIPARFQKADRFSGGLARVRINNKWGYINRSGQMVLQPDVDFAGNFSEGLAVVGTRFQAPTRYPNDLKYGYINRAGKLVIPFQFSFADAFKEGLAAVTKPGVSQTTKGALSPIQGYVNTEGQWSFKRPFDSYLAGEFSEGAAAIEPNGGACSAANYCEYAYIDTQGELLAGQHQNLPKLTGAGTFSQGLAPVATSGGGRDAGGHYPATNWGYINTKGEMVIRPQFDAAGSFSEELAWVEVNGKYGYISP